jgi:D-glycero-beta-D-manno-heptose-7-phosphate kinase
MNERIQNQLRKSSKILLIGDSCYDYYHYGDVNRISPEAPIPIFDSRSQEIKPGMASNVYENLKRMGADVHIVTEYLENKHRYIDRRSRQQLLRVDERISNVSFSEKTFSQLRDYDAIVISDYNKGFLTYNDIRKIVAEFSGPIYMDTKKTDLAEFKSVIFKINEHERKRLSTEPENMIVTNGGHNVIWYKPKPDASEIFFPPRVDVHDVCGAGDTFLAAFVFEHLRTSDIRIAVHFAMKAASVTVQKIGVYAPTLEEIDRCPHVWKGM